VDEQLVHVRGDGAALEDALQVFLQEVGDADGAEFARSVGLLERTPSLALPSA
jgi:hypothetical protein